MSLAACTTWQMLARGARGKELPHGLDAAWDRAVGLAKRMRLRTKHYLERAERIAALEEQYRCLSDAALRGKILDLRVVFRRGRDTEEHRDHAFALIREVAFRQIGLKPFPVQLAGALVLADGGIAEMATGEGKTLTAVLPATLAGWRGQGCHVITANDYLARRDAETMQRIYQTCGLRCAYLQQETPPPERKQAYLADVTYCTNKEVSADYLRDRLALGRVQTLPEALLAKIAKGAGSGTDRLVQRGLYHAIIDEVDSLLIDEAVTPLIISGEAPNPDQAAAFVQASQLAEQLQPREHYKINPRYREIEFTPAGRRRLAELSAPLGGIWRGTRRREELVNQALVARTFYQRDKQYVIQEGKVVIVDEFTGRLMPDREWRDGLHQAVSAREGLEVQPPKDTYARISFQRFFRLYRRLCGMTGTAVEGRAEFWQIYHLPVVAIPTNRPCLRIQMPDRVFATEQAKFAAIVDRIEELHRQGRPVLVGTRSVRASEHLGRLLEARGLACQILNAVRHREEAQIVAEAGQPGRITVATNMAGRGTDIKLGRGVAERGGLHVLATERHEARRIDRQLFGRCARQGDPGSAEAFVSLEDELVARHVPWLSRLLRNRYGGTNREITSRGTRALFDLAQRKAQREALRQRKGVLKNDDWLDEYLGFAGREH